MSGLYKKYHHCKEVVLKEGQYIRFLRKGDWEFVRRSNCTGIVIILAMTDEGEVILIEQYRVPVGRPVIEFPAGLVSDHDHHHGESLSLAAKRELLEETGYRARRMKKVAAGPASGGSSSDIITFLLAGGLTKIHDGGGDDTEEIRVHHVPLSGLEEWLSRKSKRGFLVDPKIYAGLYFLKKYNRAN